MSTKKVYKTQAGETVYGVMAEFDGPGSISHGAEAIRDAGYKKWDVYAPFAVHGIDEAMGYKGTKLPIIVGCMGLTMAAVGFGFQYWVRHYAYALVHQGKPSDAWQVLIPVTFEVGVLFTAFTCLLGMILFNGLPMWHHSLLKKARFLKVSDDRFMIVIEANDPSFDPEKTRRQLLDAGAMSVELVEE